MPTKWNEPPEPTPSWLDESVEVTRANDAPKLPVVEFGPRCVEALLALGCSLEQACSVAGNTFNEAAFGRSYRGWNLGGWKITKSFADAYKLKHGKPAPWWRAVGNKSSGDRPWCYYRAFDGLEHFFREWLLLFVPKPGTVGSKHRYKRSGELFWSGGDWFPALIQRGYKGEVTKANPAGSIAEHRLLQRSALVRWAQARLGVVADGAWGPRSSAACSAFQVAHALPATGTLDEPTARALLAVPALAA